MENRRDHLTNEHYLSACRAAIQSLSPIPDSAWYEMRELLNFRSYNKGDYVLTAGSIARKLYFICRGAVIIYHQDHKDKIYIKNILFENEIPAATASILKKSPSNLTIEVLEDSLMLECDFFAFRKLGQKYHELQSAYITYLEQKWVIEKEEIEISLATQEAEERYLQLLNEKPGLAKRTPLKYIANYLGITPTQLSRIRKKLLKSTYVNSQTN